MCFVDLKKKKGTLEYDSDTKDGASIQLSAFLIWYIVVHMEEVPLTILKVWEGGGGAYRLSHH